MKIEKHITKGNVSSCTPCNSEQWYWYSAWSWQCIAFRDPIYPADPVANQPNPAEVIHPTYCKASFVPPVLSQWASCQRSKIAGCACAGNIVTFSSPPPVSDPHMHHGTGLRPVPWCMPGSLTSGYLWNRRWGKCSRHSRRMRNPQFYVSGKRPMDNVVEGHDMKSNLDHVSLSLLIRLKSFSKWN